MIGSIRHLLARHQELAKENMLATVQILESQFNPHFLFNTLESIRYMIKFGPGEAEKMLVSLSRMLRYSIQNGKDVVTVKEEMDFISRYLQVMLYRYGDRLRYSIDLEEGSRNASIPRMTLQPLWRIPSSTVLVRTVTAWRSVSAPGYKMRFSPSSYRTTEWESAQSFWRS